MRTAVAVLAHPQHAGMLRALAVLDGAAPRHGWQLRFVVAGPHPLVDSLLPAARTTVVPGLGSWRSWRGRLFRRRIVGELSRIARDADLLYSVTLSSFPFCLFAGERLGIPRITHVYSSYGEPGPYRKHLLGRAQHVIAPSADSLRLAADAVGGWRPGTRGRVVYNGMDITRIVAEARQQSPVRLDGGSVIGMVGNLDWRKNPALLVEAAARIRAAVPGVRVLLIGAFADARYAAEVRARIAALGLEDTVSVTGFLSNPFPVVQQLDVLVHPALRDPFPLALLEAMALARPIVASAVGGIPEMLIDGESGRLVPPNDAEALATAVIALLQDPARRRALGEAAYARLTRCFSLEGFATAMFTAFNEAVEDGAA